jgi:Second Messenger Oligonucleotide or Dinucleotide Synthetase domain
MANCDDLFREFQDEISIPSKKRDRMLTSKKGLRDRIRKDFKEKHPGYSPKFYVQGSDKMKTAIRTKDDICDLDDGVYFMRKPDVTATTLQQWVKDAVDGYTDTEPEHRKKCIRNIFINDYEIDMPVYYKVDGKEYQLAVKDNGFEDSDPKALVDWFNGLKDKDAMLVRNVKDLKAWCDHKRNKMPSGLAMTILAANAKSKIVYNEREDITLRDTLKEIRKALDLRFECFVPVTPRDNLFASYSEERKKNFLTALDEFIEDADKALKEANHRKASKLWKKHLGDRFPEGEDKEHDKKAFAAIIAGATTSRPWAAQ